MTNTAVQHTRSEHSSLRTDTKGGVDSAEHRGSGISRWAPHYAGVVGAVYWRPGGWQVVGGVSRGREPDRMGALMALAFCPFDLCIDWGSHLWVVGKHTFGGGLSFQLWLLHVGFNAGML